MHNATCLILFYIFFLKIYYSSVLCNGFLLCFGVIFCQMSLDINPETKIVKLNSPGNSSNIKPADGTSLVLPEPLIDAFHVEEMHAGQSPHVLLHLELRQADGALVALLLLLLLGSLRGGGPLDELVRESVSLNA